MNTAAQAGEMGHLERLRTLSQKRWGLVWIRKDGQGAEQSRAYYLTLLLKCYPHLFDPLTRLHTPRRE